VGGLVRLRFGLALALVLVLAREANWGRKKQWVCVLALWQGLAVWFVGLAALPRRRRRNENTTHAGRILCFSSSEILQNFSDFLSHRIFRRMYKVLNIDKK